MRKLIFAFLLLWMPSASVADSAISGSSLIAQTGPFQLAACCKICRTGKACGNSCISRAYTCHKPPGCACDGGLIPEITEPSPVLFSPIPEHHPTLRSGLP